MPRPSGPKFTYLLAEYQIPAMELGEAGTEAIHEFTEIKSVFIDFSGKLQKAQIKEGE